MKQIIGCSDAYSDEATRYIMFKGKGKGSTWRDTDFFQGDFSEHLFDSFECF